ncbi:hypothetical protein GCE86_22620 [Micromonospora terminaliae]|uniref:Uncharacterized protein n=1 Tax=Micromonospora terminaliae TaxID=1914461 RepID=A0AAJ2ZIE8_9ACTN|nr:hypothetical protein [Micromonospora terminaliae]NES30612.1 hypothetical protein [Micromonospora terminaliae]QGL49572.1 hypothetical protein GCE86_22620 [Micromonospora terminaliae]
MLAVVCAAVVAAPVGGLQLANGGGAAQVASPLLDEPTRGDLAGDEGYLRQVRDAWQRRLKQDGEQLRGEPHIVWAGRTPAGPAAYVAHRTVHNPVASSEGDRVIAMAAFVEPTADGPRVTTREQVTDAGTDGISQAALLGPQRDVLVVLDVGQPVEFSPELRYLPDGRVSRSFQRVAFRDGAAVLAVPPQRTKISVALSRTPVSRDNMVHISNDGPILFPEGKERPRPPQLRHTLPGAEKVWTGDPSAKKVGAPAEALADYIDSAGVHTSDGSPLLWVYGATPDGRLLLVETIQYDDDPARVIALLAPRYLAFKAVASTFADWRSPLPVRLRLPDNQGVLVAAEGAALSYRIGKGQWQEAGRNAALLPADATDVRVTDAGGTVTTVPVTS